jgi:DNA replication protein DnaC
MMDAATANKLHEMRLSSMAELARLQASTPNIDELPFEERFGLLVDAEWSRRKSAQVNKLVKNARLGIPDAAPEDVEYLPDRHLDKAQIARVCTCNYIAQKKNIIVMGATGAGKSYLCCAFGVAACRNFYSVRYYRMPELLDELAAARLDGGYAACVKRLRKVRLLIVDDWLLTPLRQEEARDIFELANDRYGNASTIFGTQVKPEGWHAQIGCAALADAILDRIIHNSYPLTIAGTDSMRKRKGIAASER